MVGWGDGSGSKNHEGCVKLVMNRTLQGTEKGQSYKSGNIPNDQEWSDSPQTRGNLIDTNNPP